VVRSRNLWWKRGLDTACVLLGLPWVLPPLLLAALWIKLVSPGPVIFRQRRVGRGGRVFTLYKLRSMHVGADAGRHRGHVGALVAAGRPLVKLDLLRDPRLIPLGILLRAGGLDELPQLWNVLRGEMSLVGPRPCLPEEYRYFGCGQRIRFAVPPGLTGIWQTRGDACSTFAGMLAMDARYVRKASLWLDLAIMARTPRVLCCQLREAVRSLACASSGRDPAAVPSQARLFTGRATRRLFSIR
jgi:lipopolysaccharide/colanic/teichoic acid biosynthesis glycosyltransferase